MSNLIVYPLDLTGRHPDNLKVGELIGPASAGRRAFVLPHGAFYTASMVVRRKRDGERLTPRVDYTAVQLEIDATLQSGLQACTHLIIEAPAFGEELEIDVQYVGGQYSYSTTNMQKLIENINSDDRPIRWASIIGKPDSFNAAPHTHDAGDLYGFEYVVSAIEGLRSAILLGDIKSGQNLREYIDTQDEQLRLSIAAAGAALDNHVMDKNNPHGTNKGHLGLSLVENLPPASDLVALAGESRLHLMTAFATKLLLDTHANRRDNPHNVTKDHVGLGLVENFPVASVAIMLAGESQEHYTTPYLIKAYMDWRLGEGAPPGEIIDPTANFTIQGNLTVPDGTTHTLNFVNGSVQGTNAIVKYLWDFGGGRTPTNQTTSTLQNPTNVQFTVPAGGTVDFTVSLTVEDTDGNTHTATRIITLRKTQVAVGPTADFQITGSTTITSPANSVRLTMRSLSTAGSSDIVKLEWAHSGEAPGGQFVQERGAAGSTFGQDFVFDITLSNERSYSQTFQLTVTDDNGMSSTKTYTRTLRREAAHVNPAIIDIAVSGRTSYTEGETVTLTFTPTIQVGTLPLATWEWTIWAGSGTPFTRSGTGAPPATQQFTTPAVHPGATVRARLVVYDQGQVGSASLEKTVNISVSKVELVGPTASFNWTGGTSAPVGGTISVGVSDTSSVGSAAISSWEWTYVTLNSSSTGRTQSARNFSRSAAGSYDYTVTLRVTDANGMSHSVTRTRQLSFYNVNYPSGSFSHTGAETVTEPAFPTLAFTANYTQGDHPIAGYLWMFPDGTTSTSRTPSHTFQIPNGTTHVSVFLQVSDTAGNITEAHSSIRLTRNAAAPPVASFTTSGATTVNEGTTHAISVSDSSSGGGSTISSWVWNWGDNTTSTGRTPGPKSYTVGVGETRSFTITLTVTDAMGRSNSTTRTVTLTKNAVTSPTASFTAAGDADIMEGRTHTLDFYDTSTKGTGDIIGWSWNFGDGTTSTQQHPKGKTYSVPVGQTRNFTVRLTVTDSYGKTGTATSTAVLTKIAAVGPTAHINANGGWSVNEGEQNWVSFEDVSTPGSAPIVAWAWAFGDGRTSNVRNPGRVNFDLAPGTSRSMTMSLTVTDANGKSSTYSYNYTLTKGIWPTPSVTISIEGNTNVAHNQQHTLQFAVSVDPGAGATLAGQNWQFGDGNSSIHGHTSHTYDVPVGGSRTVTATYTAQNSYGKAASRSHTFTMHKGAAPLPPQFGIEVTGGRTQAPSGTDPYVFVRANVTRGTIVRWIWQWYLNNGNHGTGGLYDTTAAAGQNATCSFALSVVNTFVDGTIALIAHDVNGLSATGSIGVTMYKQGGGGGGGGIPGQPDLPPEIPR